MWKEYRQIASRPCKSIVSGAQRCGDILRSRAIGLSSKTGADWRSSNWTTDRTWKAIRVHYPPASDLRKSHDSLKRGCQVAVLTSWIQHCTDLLLHFGSFRMINTGRIGKSSGNHHGSSAKWSVSGGATSSAHHSWIQQAPSSLEKEKG